MSLSAWYLALTMTDIMHEPQYLVGDKITLWTIKRTDSGTLNVPN